MCFHMQIIIYIAYSDWFAISFLVWNSEVIEHIMSSRLIEQTIPVTQLSILSLLVFKLRTKSHRSVDKLWYSGNTNIK